MSLREIFTSNFLLTPERRDAVRKFLATWGVGFGVVALLVMLMIAIQTPDETSKAYDIVFKVFFAALRMILAILGYFIGSFIGYVMYQIIESTKPGNYTTRYDDMDVDAIKQVKILNRGIMLIVCTQVGGLILALALSGAGGR